MRFLAAYTPRYIPVFLDALEITVSYSDGEGDKAGMGIAVWSSKSSVCTLAAFCEIPEHIGELWDSQRRLEVESSDIFLIEQLGRFRS